MMEYVINRNLLDELGQKIYDELFKISESSKFIFDAFLLIKQKETREALYKFLITTNDLDEDKVMLKAIANSQKLALFHKL